MLSAQIDRVASGGPIDAPAAPEPQPAAGGADASAFIRAMVASLAGKLAANPDDAEGWARLVRSYGVLHDAPAPGRHLGQSAKAVRRQAGGAGPDRSRSQGTSRMKKPVVSMIVSAIVAACALIGLGVPASAAPLAGGRTIAWDSSKDGAVKTYRVGELTLTFSAGPKTEDGVAPMLTVSSPKFGRTTVTGKVGSDPLAATAVIAALDPKASGPAVILHTYTGGAHCCTHLDILDPVGGKWMTIEAGDWDGSFSVKPQQGPDGRRLSTASR